MRSMTGFGVGEAPLADGRVIAEIRSLNHRFLEIRARVPTEIADQSFFVEQRARRDLSRGRYDLVIRLESSTPAPSLDVERAKAVFVALGRLRDEIAPGTELPVSVLASVPDLFSGSRPADGSRVRDALSEALTRALAALDEMRRTEGRALQKELEARLRAAREIRAKIDVGVPQVVQQYGVRLRERLGRLLEGSNTDLDTGRLETEVALLADRSDVTEELVRLESHFAQLETLFSSDKAIGRKMDFLLQEMAREANTCGAKCQDADLSHLVVDLKAEIERLREQAQNVE